MQIVVNHLTRMQPGFICVAGIDLEDQKHIRPVLAGSRLRTHLLKPFGGPFEIASVVDLGKTEYQGHSPETEDYLFDPSKAFRVRDMGPNMFWKLLLDISQESLMQIFGDELQQQGRTCAVEAGMGTASLGCLLPSTQPEIEVNNLGKVPF